MLWAGTELVSSNSANTKNCLLNHSQWRKTTSGAPTSFLYEALCWWNHVIASLSFPPCNNTVDILKCNNSAIVLISTNRWIGGSLVDVPIIWRQKSSISIRKWQWLSRLSSKITDKRDSEKSTYIRRKYLPQHMISILIKPQSFNPISSKFSVYSNLGNQSNWIRNVWLKHNNRWEKWKEGELLSKLASYTAYFKAIANIQVNRIDIEGLLFYTGFNSSSFISVISKRQLPKYARQPWLKQRKKERNVDCWISQ